jgi:hypothetical protein
MGRMDDTTPSRPAKTAEAPDGARAMWREPGRGMAAPAPEAAFPPRREGHGT